MQRQMRRCSLQRLKLKKTGCDLLIGSADRENLAGFPGRAGRESDGVRVSNPGLLLTEMLPSAGAWKSKLTPFSLIRAFGWAECQARGQWAAVLLFFLARILSHTKALKH